MNAYRRDFDETEYMYYQKLLNELLKICNEIWEKATKNYLKKESDSDQYIMKNI